MLYEAGVLTVVGMTTVFGFLGLMVCMMHVSARLVARFPGAPEVTGSDETVTRRAESDDAELAVVLAVVAAQRGEG